MLLHKKSDDRFALTSFASHEVPEEIVTADDVAQQIKLLVKDIGGFTKSCALAVSEPNSLLRIIEQPNTPVELLRNALRFNGLACSTRNAKILSSIVQRFQRHSGVRPPRQGEGAGRSGPGPGDDPDALSCGRDVALKGETNLGSDDENAHDARALATGAGLFL